MLNRIVGIRASRAGGWMLCAALLTGLASGTTATWVKLSPAHSPSARVNMAMAYDPAGKNIVLFGGYDGAYQNDTWIFNGTDWVKVNTAVAPSGRSASAISYDRASKKMIMFGGFNGQYLGDTWIWDGVAQTWTEGNPATLPDPVTLPMAFTDPRNGHAEMVGGFDGFLYQNTTWQWTGSDWKALNPATVIWARGAALVANDYHRKQVVIFGGLADLNANNTWIWDGVNWTMENPAAQPSAGFYSAAAYDPRVQAVINFGGNDILNATYAWSGNNWLTLNAQTPPAARDSLGMAYDYATDQMIVFGGETSTDFMNDTWQLQIQ